MLALLPLQFSWAAVAAYCGHETGQHAEHLGHHEHRHADQAGLHQRGQPGIAVAGVVADDRQLARAAAMEVSSHALAQERVNGVRFRPVEIFPRGRYLVTVRGDHVLALKPGPRMDGTEGPRALDGNHLAPGLPDRCPTGDGIEGGAFESWFTLG